MNSATLIIPFSPGIEICNSYDNEDYPSGVKVTDVGTLINNLEYIWNLLKKRVNP